MEKLTEVKGNYHSCEEKHKDILIDGLTSFDYFEIKGSDYGVNEVEFIRVVEINNLSDRLIADYDNKRNELKEAFKVGKLSSNVLLFLIIQKEKFIGGNKVEYGYYLLVPSIKEFLSDKDIANALLYHEFGHLKDFFNRFAIDDEIFADNYAIEHGYTKELLSTLEDVRILYTFKENNEKDIESLEKRIQNIKSKM